MKQNGRRLISINESPTMTLNELCNLMREYGIPCSNEIIAAGIEEGKFPFAISIRKGGQGPRWNLIFRKRAEEWLQMMTGGVA